MRVAIVGTVVDIDTKSFFFTLDDGSDKVSVLLSDESQMSILKLGKIVRVIGVVMGLCINIIWVVVVLAAVPEAGAGVDTIVFANAHGLTANVPLSPLLHTKVFTVFSLIFGIFAVTSSFMTNGAGLWGYIDDLH